MTCGDCNVNLPCKRLEHREGCVFSNDETPCSDQIRYLFWKHLTGVQRLEILVKTNLIPSVAIKPLPQTMERLVLDRAADIPGKLQEIWNLLYEYESVLAGRCE